MRGDKDGAGGTAEFADGTGGVAGGTAEFAGAAAAMGGSAAGGGAGSAAGAPASAPAAEETRRGTWWRWREPVDFEQEIERLKAPDGGALLPWLLMAIGPATDIGQGDAAPAWLAATGLALFCVLYVATVRAAFGERLRSGPVPARLLGALAATALALAIGYGGDFTLLFVLVSLCVGSVSRGRRTLGLMLVPLSATAGLIAGLHHEGFWSTAGLAYGTFLSGLVVSVIITLFHAVARLKETRQELARAAVARERLRFSRDLHDLLGHTLSVIVVKSEAAQRIAPRDVDAALAQVADIETVGRQALTEIREAVTGYREGSLATELARARSALAASDIDLVVRASGRPLPAAGRSCSAGCCGKG
ncbi:histidine kinase dimerization/phosphoacceptor domain-containing protein [Actinacidiphila sp. DG2A-62]|uniref:sensor histidine kinase n=1 Tax=Actinacidiphila sp. DG2A-62 TaxID=3108821 RepID=UPI002DB75CDB|nr:histidine kinase dimerization/phosphoacceptor domain-containing protein [Actinacidiphila sp. DG2A-62]MEC3993920.1 histidine kinase dimerization/phosphoacceptor domain-containing protein [Actinacidiphila sp. DG2A-62]